MYTFQTIHCIFPKSPVGCSNVSLSLWGLRHFPKHTDDPNQTKPFSHNSHYSYKIRKTVTLWIIRFHTHSAMYSSGVQEPKSASGINFLFIGVSKVTLPNEARWQSGSERQKWRRAGRLQHNNTQRQHRVCVDSKKALCIMFCYNIHNLKYHLQIQHL